MADVTNKNKKLPIDGVSDDKKVLKYGYTTGQRDILGSQTIVYANPEEPENYFRLDLEATGSYRTTEQDSSENAHTTSLNTGRTSSYTVGGETTHIDGHKDSSCESTSRENVTGDKGVACKTNYQTSTEGSIIAHNRFKKEFVVAASESKSFVGSYGDQVNEHSGNWHEAFEKDHVEAVSGNKISMIEKGDFAVHIQKGSYDMQVSEGKLHLMTSADDLIANSNVKVLLQVGTDAKVTVEPTKIKLQVGGGSYIEITSGGIKMVSPRIDLN